MKIYFILFIAFFWISGFGFAENNEILPNLNDTNKVDKIKNSKDLKSFSDLKEITEEFGGTNSAPPPPAPGELMDGIPVPGIPDGSELNVEVQDKPIKDKEKVSEKSVFYRDSDLNPRFAIDPIQEIKEVPITKESERDEKAWEKRENEEKVD
ncbi:MAG: hypothetical protein ACTSXL_00375 [Alphaproteobacteria bacterium]